MSMAFDYPRRTPMGAAVTPRRWLHWRDCQPGTGAARRLAADTGVGTVSTDWPRVDVDAVDVVLVCQATLAGVRSAIGCIDQHAELGAPGRLVGVVCVAAEQPVPATVADHLDLIASAGVRIWRLGWGSAHTDPAMLGAMMSADGLRWVVQRARDTTRALGWAGQPSAVAAA